jgi:hypothetical protein
MFRISHLKKFSGIRFVKIFKVTKKIFRFFTSKKIYRVLQFIKFQKTKNFKALPVLRFGADTAIPDRWSCPTF